MSALRITPAEWSDHPLIVRGEVVASKIEKDARHPLVVLKGIGDVNVSCAILEDLAKDAPKPTALPKVGEMATVFGNNAIERRRRRDRPGPPGPRLASSKMLLGKPDQRHAPLPSSATP